MNPDQAKGQSRVGHRAPVGRAGRPSWRCRLRAPHRGARGLRPCMDAWPRRGLAGPPTCRPLRFYF